MTDGIRAVWGELRYNDQLPPLTYEALQATEKMLGVRLPASLVKLLRIRNGGILADDANAFPAPVRLGGWDDVIDVSTLAGAAGGEDVWDSLDASAELIAEWGLPSPLVLLAGDGHWWIALDYRECGPDGEPKVIYLDSEYEEEVVLAESFIDFLAGLRPSPR